MVTIQRVTTVSNGFGGYTESWANYLEYDGVIDQLTGNELLSADKLNPNSTHVLIGNIADITESDRVLFNGKIYDILNIDNPLNMDHHLEILLEYKGLMENELSV